MGNAQMESQLDEIIVRLGKLVTANAAAFDQLREIRICAARWERWEYYLERTYADPRESNYEASHYRRVLTDVNEYGANGWEVISIRPVFQEGVVIETVTWFKRKVGPNG